MLFPEYFFFYKLAASMHIKEKRVTPEGANLEPNTVVVILRGLLSA